MALASKMRDDQVMVIDDLTFAAPKTKDMAAILKALKLRRRQALLVTTAELRRQRVQSARNIDGVSVSPVAELNALNVLQPRRLLVTKAALDWIKEQRPKKQAAKPEAAAEEA